MPAGSEHAPARTPLRRRLRRVAPFVVAALGLTVLALLVWGRARLDGWLRAELEQRLSAALEGQVRIGRLEASLLRPRLDLSDVQVAVGGADGGARARLPWVRIRLGWRGLATLRSGRVWLVELTAREPELVIDREFLDAREGRGAEGRLDLRIGRLGVESGSLDYGDRQIPLELNVDGLSLEGAWAAPRRALIGRFSFEASVLQRPLGSALPVEARGQFRWRGQHLEWHGASLTAPGLAASGEAVVEWGDGVTFAADAEIDADLDELRPRLVKGFPEIGGRAHWSCRIEAGGGALRLSGPAEGSGVRLNRLAAGRLGAEVEYASGRLELRRLQAAAYGGEVAGRVAVQLGEPTAFTAELNGQALLAEQLFTLTGASLPLAARTRAELVLAGDPADPGTWNGSGRAWLEPMASGEPQVPAGGHGEFTLVDGVLAVAAPEFRAGAARFTLGIDMDLGAEARNGFLRLDGRTEAAGRTQRATLLILEQLGLEPPALLREPLAGQGPLRAGIDFSELWSVELTLALSDGSWAAQEFEEASLALYADAVRVDVRDLRARRGDVNLEGSLEVGGEEMALQALDVRFRNIPLEPVLRQAGREDLEAGSASGEVRLVRGAEGLRGNGRMTVFDVVAAGERVDRIDAGIDAMGERVRLTDVSASGPALEARGEASLDLAAGRVDVRIDEGRLQLERLALFRDAQVQPRGTVSVSGQLRAGDVAPSGALDVRSDNLELLDRRPGSVRGTVELDAEQAAFRIEGRSGGPWTLVGALGLGEGYPLEATVELERTTIELPLGDVEAWAELTGAVMLAGPLSAPDRLTAEANLRGAELYFGGRLLRADDAFDVRLADRRVQLGPVRLSGETTDMEARLELGLDDGALRGRIAGTIDLGVLAAPVAGLRATGRTRVEVELGGTIERPDLEGSARLAAGRIRWLGFPQALEQVAFDLGFRGQQLELRSSQALFGGGVLGVNGEASLAGAGLGAFRFEIEGSNVRLTWPEGFRGVYEGALLWESAEKGSEVNGQIRMLRGLYDEEFDVARLLGWGAREYEATEETELPEDVRLDVDVVCDGNLWVRNEMAKVESRFDLHVGGELARPEITGRATLFPGGRLRFRNVEYELVSGTLDFVQPEGINPYVNVRAETTVNRYDVLLQVEGTLDRFDYQLTSTPTLSQQDIIALLTTGRTLQELTSRLGSDTGVFTGDLAANYFAGALTDPFERQLQRLLGLERVQIDPLLIGDRADPTARVTLGKEVARDLFLVASTDIGSSERQLYQIEWQASRKFRLTAGRDITGGIGGDFQYTDRFWFDRAPPRRLEPAEPAGKPTGASGGTRVAAVEIEGVPQERREELLRRIPLRADEPFSRSRMYEGIEAVRRSYVKRGRIEAQVRAEEQPLAGQPDRVRVRYTVEAGPQFQVEFEGIERRQQRRLRERLETSWSESMMTEDLLDESVELIQQELRDRGFYAVDVQIRQSERDGVRNLLFVIDTGKQVRVERIEIVGAEQIPEERIRQQLLIRRSFLGRPTLVPRVLQEDLAAVRNLYRDQGYLRANVEPPRIRLSADGQSATITLRIDEGPRFTVESVEFPALEEFTVDELRDWAALNEGEVYSSARLLEAESRLRSRMDERGHPDARVRGRAEIGDERVVVRFALQPGTAKRVGALQIEGNDSTKRRIIQRELLFAPGDPISRDRLLRTQHRLYKLGIFRNVRIDFEPMGADEPELYRVRVQVEEDKPLMLRLGAGYDSEAGPRGSFSLVHQNVGGWDRTLGLQGRVSDLEKRAQLTAEEPRLLGLRVPTLFNLLWEEREQVSFSERRRASALRLERRLNPRWTGYARYSFQQVDLSDVQDPVAVQEEKLENLVLGDIGLTAVRDTRDDPFFTTRGAYGYVEVRLFAKPLLSQSSFTKAFLQSSQIFTFRNGHAWASAVRVGLAEPFGDTTRVPLSERFFAGGDSTLRGFPRDEVGPQSGGVPTGGEAMFLVNEEWRFPIKGRLRGVMFYDAGNVYSTLGDFDPTDLRHVLGAGLRLETPIGPLRLEYGHKLDRRVGESSGEVVVAIGSVF